MAGWAMSAHRGSLRKALLTLFIFILFITTGARGQVRPRVIEAVDNSKRITLTGNVHPLARAEFDHGAVADAQPITRILLLLKGSDEQEAELQTVLEEQQDKSSTRYQQWLTPAEFGALYGPADADIQAVTQWLGSQGFTVERVYSGKRVIEFSGTAAQVRAAFGTEIHKYEVEGKTYTANTNDPQVPVAIAPVVSGIVSLNSFPRQSHIRVKGIARKKPGGPGLEPLFTFPAPASNGNFYGMAPGDFATIYNSSPLLQAAVPIDGTGQVIAIVGETNINVADVEDFRQMFGLPANFTLANVILNGEDPGITSPGEEGESDLDTEWSGAVAPGANVYLVVSASTQASPGVDLSALYIIDHNLAGVLSDSYGNCEVTLGTAENSFYKTLWEEAAAQGITAIVSAGDGGSAGCDDFNSVPAASGGLAVNGFASTPYNVSVGGTDFDQINNWALYWNATNGPTGASAKSYIPEIPWSESCAQLGIGACGNSPPAWSQNIVAGSGGPSALYDKPSWQMGVVGMPNDSRRDQPDVSLFASPGFDWSGYVYCQSDETLSGAKSCDINNASSGTLDFGIVGGTSASAPAFAGIVALVNQYQASHQGSARQGNANYVLYQLAKKAGASCTSSTTEATGCIFNDVVHGNSYLVSEYGTGVGTNSVPCYGGTPNCSATGSGQFGVLVDPSNPMIEAWTATAGYDMATGLGSVNVNNLVTNWGTVATVPTATTLTLSRTTGITHGTAENVNVNITVTPTSGTAMGDVSLIAKFADGTTQGLEQFTLTNGQVTNGPLNSLPGGTNYTVTAHYAGDGTNAPSDSSPVTVTVAPESSQTFIVIPTFDWNGNYTNGNATSAPYGSSYNIRIYVTDKNGVASPTGPPNPTCYGENLLTCPTGTVTLTDNGALWGTGGGGAGIYNLNVEGYTRDLQLVLSTGAHTLAAHYSGDNSYQGSTTVTNFTVTKAVNPIQLLVQQNNVVEGESFQLWASITWRGVPGTAPPTGTVTFYNGSSVIPGTVQMSSAPDALNGFLITSFSSTGPQVITAQYSGDNNYAPLTSSPVNMVSLIPTTLTETVSATTISLGQTVAVTAKATGNTKSPAMTGQILLGGPYVGFGNVTTTPGTDANGNQTFTATVTATPTATGPIGAVYSGDANYASAMTAGNVITVIVPDFSMNANPTSLAFPAGQTGTLQMNIVPTTNISSSVLLTCAGNAPNGYTCSLQPSTVNLANGATSTATLTLAPSPSSASAVQNAIRPKQGGISLLPITPGPLWPVSILSGVAALLLLTLPRRKRHMPVSLACGLVFLSSLIISCGGVGSSGGEGGGGGSGPPYATTTIVSTSSAKAPQGTQVTFTATVSGKGNPTGGVNFYLNGSWYGLGNIVAGTATLSTAIATPGVYSLTAQYAGDSQNSASTSAAVSQAVTGSTVMQVNGQTNTISHSDSVTVTLQ